MAMNTREMSERARSLIDGGREAPWLEFKCNNADPTRIGEYVSAISNAAALHDQEEGFAIWGVEDVSGSITGTTFDPNTAKIGGQPLLMHLAQLLSPAIRPPWPPECWRTMIRRTRPLATRSTCLSGRQGRLRARRSPDLQLAAHAPCVSNVIGGARAGPVIRENRGREPQNAVFGDPFHVVPMSSAAHRHTYGFLTSLLTPSAINTRLATLATRSASR